MEFRLDGGERGLYRKRPTDAEILYIAPSCAIEHSVETMKRLDIRHKPNTIFPAKFCFPQLGAD